MWASYFFYCWQPQNHNRCRKCGMHSLLMELPKGLLITICHFFGLPSDFGQSFFHLRRTKWHLFFFKFIQEPIVSQLTIVTYCFWYKMTFSHYIKLLSNVFMDNISYSSFWHMFLFKRPYESSDIAINGPLYLPNKFRCSNDISISASRMLRFATDDRFPSLASNSLWNL